MRVLFVTGVYSSGLTGHQEKTNDILRASRIYDYDDITFEVLPLKWIDQAEYDNDQIVHCTEGSLPERFYHAMKAVYARRSAVDVVHFASLSYHVVPLIAGSLSKPVVFGPYYNSQMLPIEEYDPKSRELLMSEFEDEVRDVWLHQDTIQPIKLSILDSPLFRQRHFLDFTPFSRDARLISRNISRSRTSVLPLGVCRDVFKPPEQPGDVTLPLNLLFITTQGRHIRKGMKVLFEAIDHLNEQGGPSVQVTVLGADSPPTEISETYGDVRDQFWFEGWVDRSQIASYYRRSDLYVQPSYYETQSATMVESLSCGTPCLATDDQPFRSNAIGDNTLFFERGDGNDLADAIRRFAAEPNQYTRAALSAADEYDIRKSLGKLDDIYGSII